MDLHRQPGHRPGHLRVLRGDRPAPPRRDAGGHDHAHRGAGRDGRRPAAGGDDERRGGAVRGGRSRADRAAAPDPLPRRAGGRPGGRRAPLRARQARAARAERGGVRKRGGALPGSPRTGLRGRHRHRSDQRARPAGRLRPRRADARRGCRAARAGSRGVRAAGARVGRGPLLRHGRLHGPRCGGVRLRQQPARRGQARRLRARLRLSGLRARLRAPAVLRGARSVPLGGAVGRSERHRGHRSRRAGGVPGRREPRALDPHGRGADRLPGAAGAHLLARLRGAAAARAALQRHGGERRAECADRDRPRSPRLRLGGLAVPRDRVDARRLGRDRRLAAPERAGKHGGRRHLGEHPSRRRRGHRPLDPRRHGLRGRRLGARGREARPRAHGRPRDGGGSPRRCRLRARAGGGTRAGGADPDGGREP